MQRLKQGDYPDLIFFFKKVLYDVKANGLHISFNIFDSPRLVHTIKTNYIKICVDPGIC